MGIGRERIDESFRREPHGLVAVFEKAAYRPQAGFIADAIANIGNDEKLDDIKGQVNQMMKKFPLYANRLA